jgi:hypothetical protein
MIQDEEFLSQELTEVSFLIFKIVVYFIALGSKYYSRASGKNYLILSLNISFIFVYNIDVPPLYDRFPLTMLGFLQS